MDVQPRLLDHPFYQAWTSGEVPLEILAQYHRSYGEFVQRIPSYWDTVIRCFQPVDALDHPVVREEREHVDLWELWGMDLPSTTSHPHAEELISGFDRMGPSMLLGALQAFEVQQPEVARTKREGLIAHYNLSEKSLKYFDEHLREESHIDFGQRLAVLFADKSEYLKGFKEGADLVYRSLDAFVPLLMKRGARMKVQGG